MKIDIILNMETADPDDVLTLCFLSTHPKVNLTGITVCPGSKHQIGLVKYVLKQLELDIPIGSRSPNHPKQCVSDFHYKWLGRALENETAEPDGLGEEIIAQALREKTKIVSGAALSCLGKYLNLPAHQNIDEVVVQGGFAGDSVVPEEYRLEKFKGKETCPTFNLNADIPAAKTVIAAEEINLLRFVSKNVCHGVIYDQAMHERIKPFKDNTPGLAMMIAGMEIYLRNKPSGKAFHDPLAACVAIDPTICQFREVEVYREKGEWGSRLKEGSNVFISIAVDREKFEKVLVSNE